MERITIENIEHELTELLEHGTMCCGDLEKFNILCDAMRNIAKVHQKFTEDDAAEWVAALDPPARWTKEQTTEVMYKAGYSHKPCEFWAVMNMLYSDYGKTMVKFGADKPEIWAAMAHDFLDDPDAVPGKVGRYYRDIVKHE